VSELMNHYDHEEYDECKEDTEKEGHRRYEV
jgi:hypothetical protein